MSFLLTPLAFRLSLFLHFVLFIVEFITLRFCVTLRRIAIRPSKFLLLAIVLELRGSHHLVARRRRLGHTLREPSGETRIGNDRVQPLSGRGRTTILEHIFGFWVPVTIVGRFALIHI
jgi:hypothetical protein